MPGAREKRRRDAEGRAGLIARIRARARPLIARTIGTAVYRAFIRYRVQRGSRLAAAITYSAFLSLFPLLAVAAAIAAAVLGESGTAKLRARIEHNLPGIVEKLPLDAVVSHAATIGVVSSLLLVWTGLSWVNAARGCLRTIWRVEDMPGAFVTRKLADLASLVGLGAIATVSLSAATASFALGGVVLRALGFADTPPARVLLWLLGVAVGLAASTAMFAYLLAGIPRLHIPRGVLLRTALVAAILFEVTKSLLAAYIGRVAGRSLYGAFGVPVALLLWLDLTFQALLFLSAWTATRTLDLLDRPGQ
ncbi:YihY/virulence factor BrkB family protein [Actinocrinis puniceicyclus]|uniref:YihY/virulence factor BrkB family protein n=1 Tax=Actinocrinis puniceicyclus TaxID=977794 RepID=A0A8J7WIW4_9ACTN|nr:YihY/virulence factor BrkB family protein [Actinocrinis puniceicyclus]MBS2961745.1 YihY/virulence factor BrkB family protein [Actinocrinis puniceicyclus]